MDYQPNKLKRTGRTMDFCHGWVGVENGAEVRAMDQKKEE